MPGGMSLVKALEQRLKLVDTAPAFPFPCFDLAAARLPREVDYPLNRPPLGLNSSKSVERQTAACFALTRHFSNSRVFPPTVLPNWMSSRRSRRNRKERQTRHHVGHIVPFHQKEAVCFSPMGLSETCIKVPSWFVRYEVHYGLHVETPPIASYRGSALMGGEQSPQWQIFLTECAALASYELMYQARQGRLHFITVDLRRLIRNLGSKTITFDRDDIERRLETLIDEIDMIKWSEVSPQNQALPGHACDTIVSITGNWVAFGTEAWEAQMEDSMYLIPDEWGAKAFDYPRVALTGLIDRRAEEKRLLGQHARVTRAGYPSGSVYWS